MDSQKANALHRTSNAAEPVSIIYTQEAGQLHQRPSMCFVEEDIAVQMEEPEGYSSMNEDQRYDIIKCERPYRVTSPDYLC